MYNLKALPTEKVAGDVVYRIAYIALCVQNDEKGVKTLQALQHISYKNPSYIQFGSAEWFWKQCVNSVVIQMAPERFKHLDRMVTHYEEAVQIQEVRDWFFEEMEITLCNPKEEQFRP
jgi:hypothetical protein